MQQKLTALFRKLEVDGNTYYRCDFVVNEFVPNERFDQLEKRLSSGKSKFYITATEELFNKLGIKEDTIFCEKNDGLKIVNDKLELDLVSSKFKEEFEAKERFVPTDQKDTQTPVYSQEDIINNYVNAIYNDTKCHKAEIRKIVQSIVFNNDLCKSNITSRDKALAHDNLVLFGPLGSGKSMVTESLKRNLDMPTIEVELTEDVELNREIIENAIANSDKEFDGHAVVIVNLNYAEFAQLFKGDSFYPFKELIHSSNEAYSSKLEKPIDFRNLTYITSLNVGENMLGIEHLNKFFLQLSGCTKAVEFSKLNKTDVRRVLLSSVFSKLIFCQEEAAKYNREFEVDKKILALLITYNDDFGGNLLCLDEAILDSFKDQLNKGYKKIVIGIDTLEILKKIVEREIDHGVLSNAPENEVIDEDVEEEHDEMEEEFENSLQAKEQKINEITEEIKKVVKGQDEKIRELVEDIMDNQENAHDPNEKYPEHNKVNIMIRGASGTGKTEIIRSIARILNIPMVVEDATRYTEEGYVGESVTNMLLDLYRATGENLDRAEKGIIVIDEIDKKANTGLRSDVSRGAVLDSLLKMVEGEKYQLEMKKATPMGMVAQTVPFDTRRLTFICLGAFDGLDKHREDRIQRLTKPKKMGLLMKEEQEALQKELDSINRDFINEDYVSFGFTEQFVNRFDKKIYLNKLDKAALLDIAKNSLLSPLRLLQDKYRNYGIEIVYTDDFYDRLTDIAVTKNSGARALKEVFGDLKQFLGFSNIEKSKYSAIIFNAKCFDDANELGLVEKTPVKQLIK